MWGGCGKLARQTVLLVVVALLFGGSGGFGALEDAQGSISGSLFFHTRNQHILDEALGSGGGKNLEMDTVRDQTGIGKEGLEAVKGVVEGLGGSVVFVSVFHDWIKLDLPKSLMYSRPVIDVDSIDSGFFDASKNDAYGFLVHHVAAGVKEAGVENMVSHMTLDSPEVSSIESERYNKVSRRRLSAEDDAFPPANVFDAVMLDGPNYQMFTSDKSEAVLRIGMWLNSPTMFIQCMGEDAPYLLGDGDPDCTEVFDEVTVVMNPMFTNAVDGIETIRLNVTEDMIRKTCKDVPSICDTFPAEDFSSSMQPNENTYVYGIPLFKYARPNVLYQASMHISVIGLRPAITIPLNDLVPKMYNYKNASAWTIRELYGVDSDLEGTQENVQGTALYVGVADSSVNVTALNEYLSLLKIPSSHSQLEIDDSISVNNASLCLDEPEQCGEEMLDVQALQSFAPNARTIFTPSMDYSINVTNAAEKVLLYLDSMAEPGLDIISISWARDYTALGLTIEVLENRLKKLASLGKTIVAATGDGGADSFPGDGCWSTFSPLVSTYPGTSWPASSPWVTSIGATQLLATGPDYKTEEIACMKSTNGGVTSSGGFSGAWLNVSTPTWQQSAVDTYLRKNNASTFSGFPSLGNQNFNSVGRGYPDISAYGAFFPVLGVNGDLNVQAGTSLSAPIVASLFTLANQKLVSDGYEKIGYANPMLYWMAAECPDAFNDITRGNNQVGINGDACPYGYPTDSAWDPVTGLGTMKFDPFVQCAKIWQDKGVSGRFENESKASASGSQSIVVMAFNIALIFHLFV